MTETTSKMSSSMKNPSNNQQKSTTNNGIDHFNDELFNSTPNLLKTHWDPLHSADWDSQNLSVGTLSRIKNDIQGFIKDPPPGIYIEPDLECLQKIHALIIGPEGTPYQNGFFYFLLRFPPDYPIRSPRCRLMTTGNGTVRFNPNLYKNGKICLSILGTWTGPAWSPAQCLASVLLSIQSLMSECPYHNEPGFEKERTDGAVRTYNDIIRHETIRVAVCEMMENPLSVPKELRKILEKKFLEFYPSYVKICHDYQNSDGQRMTDPFGDSRGTFSYSSLSTRIEILRSKSDKVSQNTIDDDEDQRVYQKKLLFKNSSTFTDEDFNDYFGGFDDEDDDEENQNEVDEDDGE